MKKMLAFYIGQDAIWADRPTNLKGIAYPAPGSDDPESACFGQWTFTPAGNGKSKYYIVHSSDLEPAGLEPADKHQQPTIENVYKWVAVDRYADRRPRLWEGDWCTEQNSNPEMPALCRGSSHLGGVKAMLAKEQNGGINHE
ncbi:MAG TPA: hypothetical protein VI728_11095 [Syntrophales bacterium]|nr:hypothetical protein [Syntrophales bacterium]